MTHCDTKWGGPMSEFQTRLHEAFQQAQTRAAARARELEQEARKVLEKLGDRAQAELKVLLASAAKGSREQLTALGIELEKLGKKLQEIAVRSAPKGGSTDSASPPQPN
jgi:phytoene/squalene synthetase